MKCDSCGSEVAVYELFQRSYRLYAYLCRTCRKGFLAHHFDLNLEIYKMEELSMKEEEGLIFITGLKAEPRVFDFKINRDIDSVIVCEKDYPLGELANSKGHIFAAYSEKARKRLCRKLGLPIDTQESKLAEEVAAKWKTAK